MSPSKENPTNFNRRSVNIKELVKAKNMDLMISSFNREVNKVNREGFIIKDSPEVKKLRHKYEGIVARLDTDKNSHKKDNKYIYKALESNKIVGLKGINQTIKIEGEE